MSNHVHLTIEENLARVTFDRHEANANIFDSDVMNELFEHLNTIEKNQSIERVLFTSAKKNIFIAGADINVIKSLTSEREAIEAVELGQKVFEKITKLKPTTVACIHGACMGGGCELTLACDVRVASTSSKTKMALPEVMLGILPAWGGTTRLPRMIDYDKALDLLLSGRMLDGKKALKMSLVDACCPEEALLTVAKTIKKKKKKSSFKSKLINSNMLRGFILKQARKGVMKKTRGLYPAPLAILDILDERPSHQRSLQLEAQHFGRLALSSECHNLVKLFLSKEAADKDSSWKEKVDHDIPPTSHLAVLGAGVMGGGIAHLAAKKNFPIYMRDINNEGLAAGMKAAHQLANTEIKRRRLRDWDARARLARIHPVLTLGGFSQVDCVIEAVVENIDIKKKALQEVEAACMEGALIASNTSSISITEIAKALKHPENFIGIHFFNPVHRMPLIEIIKGEKTSDETVARAVALSQALGKTPVVVNDGPGFLVNRLLAPYMNEALRMVEEGIHPEHIDTALLDYGMPMGPIRLSDEVGLDVAAKVGHILSDGLGPRMAGPQLLDELAEQQQLGKKTGQGFYNYKNKKTEVVKRFANHKRSGNHKEIQLRVLLPMFNEACRCIEDGIIIDHDQLDLAMIMGTGYAPFRGGPLSSAKTMGYKSVENMLNIHSGMHGERFKPCDYLTKLAHKNA